ncbi:hypothetical protein [Amorphus sp. 3PC139-8]|uniref:hypothetical protein n=1 Tax=Amorphus sp. 3PC139-8 TaxID=2735676 RepID=UPI00345DC509
MTATYFGVFYPDSLTIDEEARRATMTFHTTRDDLFTVHIGAGAAARAAQRALRDQKSYRLTVVTGARSESGHSLELEQAGLTEFHGTLAEESEHIGDELTGALILHAARPALPAGMTPGEAIPFSIPGVLNDPALEADGHMVLVGTFAADSVVPAILGASAACERPRPSPSAEATIS